MTIYALSSGPGVSGIAVIRISGQETSKAIELLTGRSVPEPRVATLRKINKINTSELIDEGIILWFPGPESYTGEDMAEIQVHGSKAVIDALHASISDIENCRLAEPGEFTKLAFQNGKINLLKAESVADLISSETEIQRQQAIKIMNGKSSDQFNFLREKLIKILSYVEAQIKIKANQELTRMYSEGCTDCRKGCSRVALRRGRALRERFSSGSRKNLQPEPFPSSSRPGLQESSLPRSEAIARIQHREEAAHPGSPFPDDVGRHEHSPPLGRLKNRNG